jgi:hypothetical protein
MTRPGVHGWRALFAALLLVVCGGIASGASGLQVTAALPAYPSAAAAATTGWGVDGQNSTGVASDSGPCTFAAPCLTYGQIAKRIGNLPVSVTMQVSLRSNMQATDAIYEPLVGLGGCFFVEGFYATTILTTGTLTAAAAQSGNSPATATDTGKNFNTACGGGSCRGYRLHITSGGNAGVVAWILAVTSATTVAITDPELAVGKAACTGGFLSSEALAAGNPYAVEALPTIPSVVSPYGVASGTNGSAAPVRILYDEVAFVPSSVVSIRNTGSYNDRAFYDSNMGYVSTSANVYASAWGGQGLSGGGSVQFSTGTQAFVYGSGFPFSAGYLMVAVGASVTLDQGTLAYGGGITVYGGLATGSVLGGGAGAINSASAGIVAESSSHVQAFGPLFGAGNATYGIQVSEGTGVSYAVGSKPTITGAVNDTDIGGVPTAYALVPTTTATNFSYILVGL